jgi:exonuclease III
MLFLDVPVNLLGLVILKPGQRRNMDAGCERVIAGSAVAVAAGEGFCRRHIESGELDVITFQIRQRARYLHFDHDGLRDAFRGGPSSSETMSCVERCGEGRRRRRIGCRFDVAVLSDALCLEGTHLGCKGAWLRLPRPSAREFTR